MFEESLGGELTSDNLVIYQNFKSLLGYIKIHSSSLVCRVNIILRGKGFLECIEDVTMCMAVF